jgi:hypothetical protein
VYATLLMLVWVVIWNVRRAADVRGLVGRELTCRDRSPDAKSNTVTGLGCIHNTDWLLMLDETTAD